MSQTAVEGAPSLPVTASRKISFSNRYLPPLFITTILVVGHFAYAGGTQPSCALFHPRGHGQVHALPLSRG